MKGATSPENYTNVELSDEWVAYNGLTLMLPESCEQSMGVVTRVYDAILPMVRMLLTSPWFGEGLDSGMFLGSGGRSSSAATGVTPSP